MSKSRFGQANDVKAFLGASLLTGALIAAAEGVLNGVLLRHHWDLTMTSLDRPLLGGPNIAVLNVLCLILGGAIVGLYRAFMPRFGPGAASAIRAGLMAWLLAYVLGLGWAYAMGIYPHAVYWWTLAWALVELPLAAMAGAWLHRRWA